MKRLLRKYNRHINKEMKKYKKENQFNNKSKKSRDFQMSKTELLSLYKKLIEREMNKNC